MTSATEKRIQETEQELFESEEFRPVRELLCWTPPNHGESEDLEVLLERIEKFAPDAAQWIDSFNLEVTK
jgi:hypothetical protein